MCVLKVEIDCERATAARCGLEKKQKNVSHVHKQSTVHKKCHVISFYINFLFKIKIANLLLRWLKRKQNGRQVCDRNYANILCVNVRLARVATQKKASLVDLRVVGLKKTTAEVYRLKLRSHVSSLSALGETVAHVGSLADSWRAAAWLSSAISTCVFFVVVEKRAWRVKGSMQTRKLTASSRSLRATR